jgi:hypothetical protein
MTGLLSTAAQAVRARPHSCSWQARAWPAVIYALQQLEAAIVTVQQQGSRQQRCGCVACSRLGMTGRPSRLTWHGEQQSPPAGMSAAALFASSGKHAGYLANVSSEPF